MLSDWEREQLAVIERHLYADRDFLAEHRQDSPRRWRGFTLMASTGLVGMAVIVVGVATSSTPLGVLGFVTMLAGAGIGSRHLRQPERTGQG